MDIQINEKENGIQLSLNFVTQQTRDIVWSFLHTKEGLASWFPELKVEEEDSHSQLFFVANGISEDLEIIEEVPPAFFSFRWAEAIVSFMMEELDNGVVKVVFQEKAPFSFPDLAKDLTSWTLKMVHLHKEINGDSYLFDQERFDEIETYYRQRLDEFEGKKIERT